MVGGVEMVVRYGTVLRILWRGMSDATFDGQDSANLG